MKIILAILAIICLQTLQGQTSTKTAFQKINAKTITGDYISKDGVIHLSIKKIGVNKFKFTVFYDEAESDIVFFGYLKPSGYIDCKKNNFFFKVKQISPKCIYGVESKHFCKE